MPCAYNQIESQQKRIFRHGESFFRLIHAFAKSYQILFVEDITNIYRNDIIFNKYSC